MLGGFDKFSVFLSAARRKEAHFTLLKHEGNSLVKKGLFQEALEKYTECLSVKPDECAVYTNRLVQNNRNSHVSHNKVCVLVTQVRLDLLRTQIWSQTQHEHEQHYHFRLLLIYLNSYFFQGVLA